MAIPGLEARALALLAAAVLISLLGFLHQASGDPRDFATHYAAGVAVAAHRDPYNLYFIYAEESKLAGRILPTVYPFRDAPPLAQGFRLLVLLPFRLAVYLWLAVLLLAAFVTIFITARLVGLRPRTPTDYLMIAGVAVTFAPLRNGLSLDQVDPALCAITTLGFYAAMRASGRGGLLQALAVLKPQATLIASVGGWWGAGLRFLACELLGIACVVTLSIGLSTAGLSASWGSWLGTLNAASQHPSAVAALILIPVTTVLAFAALRGSRRSDARIVRSLAVAAAVNGAIAPLVFLHLQSDVLLCVPAGLAAVAVAHRRAGGAWSQIALGVALGLLFVDGLFPVVHYAGIEHVAVPLALAVLLAVASLVSFPALRCAILIGFAVNLIVTLVPVGPSWSTWFSVIASLLLLALLARVASPGASVAPDAGAKHHPSRDWSTRWNER